MLEVSDFGVNPGNLGMFKYVPSLAKEKLPLVIGLHGCQQSAAEFDLCTGWSELATEHGFALVLPQQKPSNNCQGCFNWFQSEDIYPNSGEVASIYAMIMQMLESHRIDRTRIFLTGLSAGGAMACALLASYPELFAGGAIIAGLPYRAANGAFEAFRAMSCVRGRSSRQWGDLVREAQPLALPKKWPKISIWHGSRDSTVTPDNALAMVRQWADLHQVRIEDQTTDLVDGQSRCTWRDGKGQAVVELYTIDGMAHGVPINTKYDGPGMPAHFGLDVGISSTFHIAKSWGLLTKKPIENVA